MKLRNSATEMKLRDLLVASEAFVLRNPKIVNFLERVCGAISSAYVLGHTPDQGEDFYVVLVNGITVAKFEIPRLENGGEPENLVVTTVEQYRNSIRGRSKQLQLEIARNLSAKKSSL